MTGRPEARYSGGIFSQELAVAADRGAGPRPALGARMSEDLSWGSAATMLAELLPLVVRLIVLAYWRSRRSEVLSLRLTTRRHHCGARATRSRARTRRVRILGSNTW